MLWNGVFPWESHGKSMETETTTWSDIVEEILASEKKEINPK